LHHVRRVLEPDQVLLRRVHRREPVGGHVQAHGVVVASVEDDDRAAEIGDVFEIRRDKSLEQMRERRERALADGRAGGIGIVRRESRRVVIVILTVAAPTQPTVFDRPFGLDVDLVQRHGAILLGVSRTGCAQASMMTLSALVSAARPKVS
jgi:hypothetical protein